VPEELDYFNTVMRLEVLHKRVVTAKNKVNAAKAVANKAEIVVAGVLADEVQRKIKAASKIQIIKNGLQAAKQAQAFIGLKIKLKK